MRAVIFSVLGLAIYSVSPASACEQDSDCHSDLELLLKAEDEAQIFSATPSARPVISASIDGEAVAGKPSSEDQVRRTDVELEAVDIQVKYDGLGGEKSLAVTTQPNKRIHQRSSPIKLLAEWNYPDWISHGEVRIYRKKPRFGSLKPPAYRLRLSSNREAILPPDTLEDGEYSYSLRVYDRSGRYDETEPYSLVISSFAGDHRLLRANSGSDSETRVEEVADNADPATFQSKLSVSNIPIQGGAITVYGQGLPEGYQVTVLDRPVPVSTDNEFVVQEVLPSGEHDVRVLVYNPRTGKSIEFERPVNIPRNDWFYVGIADLTVGKRLGRDSRYLAPVAAGEYDPVYKKGRLAFYLKGKIQGRYILTAALDTTEENIGDIFSNLDRKDARQLLRRLDPDDYYPVYGDDSVTREDAPTSGRFYIRIDRGSSHVMWGNFKTRVDGVELARYERALYGAQADLKTETVTEYGEPVASIKAFAAQPGSLPRREEFRGTGGSVYFLGRQDINQGSEQVAVELRDATTGLTVERRVLNADEDYTLDYVQGVLLLEEPLASAAKSSGPVLDSGLSNYHQYVVVNYEYTPALGDVDGYSYGGRAEAWLQDHLRVGVTGYQENTGEADQTLVGADITLQLTEKSYFQFEWAQSEGDTFPVVTSTDGGFIFNPISGEAVAGTAQAWRARMLLDLAELTGGAFEGKIAAGYEEREAGFNAPGRYTNTDERVMDAQIAVKPSDDITVTARYDEVQRDEGVSNRELSAEVAVRINEAVSIETGVVNSYKTEGNHSGKITKTASSYDGVGNRTDIGARINFHGAGNDKFYVFGQKTVDRDTTRDRNDRIGVGFETDITDRMKLNAEVSTGTSGIGLLAGIVYNPTPDEKYHVGYRMVPDSSEGRNVSYDPFGRDNGTFVAGVRRKLTETTTAWTEHTYDLMGTNQGNIRAYGVDFAPDDAWRFSAGIETGVIEDADDANFDRVAPSLRASYQAEGLNFNARLEARFEDSDDDTRDRTTWLAKTAFNARYNDNWRFLAHLDAAISDSDESSIQNANYIEGSVGWAYRPVDSDRFNALFKYTYLHDLPAPQQSDADNRLLGPKQRSHIVSADFIYDITERLSIGAKYGYRTGEISITRDEADFYRSTAHLGVIRADYHVIKNWDIFAEARVLKLSELEQADYGALLGIYRHIGDNLKFGIGYNFGRFSDDLSDLTYDDRGIFFNLVGKF